MNQPLVFSPDHCWARREADTFVIGVTPLFVASARGALCCTLPPVGAELRVAERFASVETDKSSLDVFSPCAGTVIAVNARLATEAVLLRGAPLTDGWLVRARGRVPQLMTRQAYEARFPGALDGA